MRYIIVFALAGSVFVQSPSLLAQAAAQGQRQTPSQPPGQVTATAAGGQTVIGDTVQAGEAGISGLVATPTGEPLANTLVRARDLLTNEIVGSVRTSDKGEFSIVGLKPANYVLEILDNEGLLIGTSAFISAAAGSILSAVTVTATTGALTAVNTATGLVATLGATAARGVTAAAAASGVAGVVVPEGIPTASPSR